MDLPELIALSEKAFADYNGRYHAERKISPASRQKFMVNGCGQSFQGWADWILVAEIEGEIAGYGIWKKPSQSGDGSIRSISLTTISQQLI